LIFLVLNPPRDDSSKILDRLTGRRVQLTLSGGLPRLARLTNARRDESAQPSGDRMLYEWAAFTDHIRRVFHTNALVVTAQVQMD
jgi:hypothetical protein